MAPLVMPTFNACFKEISLVTRTFGQTAEGLNLNFINSLASVTCSAGLVYRVGWKSTALHLHGFTVARGPRCVFRRQYSILAKRDGKDFRIARLMLPLHKLSACTYSSDLGARALCLAFAALGPCSHNYPS